MIVYLSGTPMVTSTLTSILCGGVGYGVMVTASTRSYLSGLEHAELFVYTHVKDDAIDLYGFQSEDERLLFLKLIDVDGIGPKTAIAIMDRGVTAIISAIRGADVSFFQSVPRVGKKSAQKIIIELKGKLGGEDLNLVEPEGKAKEVVEALVSLGFSESESAKWVAGAELGEMRVEDAVKLGIQTLTKKS